MDIEISVQNVVIDGELDLPVKARSLVIFLVGIKSGEFVGSVKDLIKKNHEVGIGTLKVDLMTESGANATKNQFDIEVLTERLIAVTKWCLENEKTKGLKLGYFGSGVGTAAVLSTAAYWGTQVKAVISVNGRPDLAMDVLDLIEAPTLFIVSGDDKKIVDFNRTGYQKMGCIKKMETVHGTVDLDKESMSRKVFDLTEAWFSKYL